MILLSILTILIIPLNKAKADQIRLTPHIDYVYPTNIQTFSNQIISDDRYWGIKMVNTQIVQSLVFGYDYTPPVAGEYYDYVFKIYSDREPPKFVLNGNMCQTQSTMIGGTTTGTTLYYDSVSMVYCNNIPASQGLQLTMYNELVNTYASEWKVGISWQVSVTRRTNNGNQIVSDLNDIKNTDISNSDKEQPSQQNYDSVHTFEEGIFSDLDDPNILSLIDLGIDPETNNWIWNTMTGIFNANVRVMSMVISVLTLGLAKFLMGR